MEELIYKLDYVKDPTDKRDYVFSNSPLLSRASDISVYDWSKAMSPVKDQGRLGSCVGFALTAMKEWQEIREKTIQRKLNGVSLRDVANLSEAWVYWNSKLIDPWPGVEGTSIRYAMKVLQKQGIPPEYTWLYNDINRGEPHPSAARLAIWGMIGSYWRIENLSDLKKALTVQPVPIGILCFREIMSVGSNGVIPMPARPDEVFGGHAICCVGFSDVTRRLKFKNSWGSNWGARGYGYISYEYAEKYMLDAWACSDLKVDDRMYRTLRKQLGSLEQTALALKLS
jgi:hypothetical protein